VGAHPSGTKTVYDGTTYDSGSEAKYAQFLDAEVRAGRVLAWKYHPEPFPLVVYGALIATWHPDFLYLKRPGNEMVYVEVKGRWKPESKLKMKLFAALFPQHTLEIVGTPMDRRTKAARAAKAARTAAKKRSSSSTASGSAPRASRRAKSAPAS